jgi:hypothetical protein
MSWKLNGDGLARGFSAILTHRFDSRLLPNGLTSVAPRTMF